MPVLLGGAALTRTYVERDLREVYDGRALLRQGRVRGPAHDGHAHGRASAPATLDPDFGRDAGGRELPPRKRAADAAATAVDDARRAPTSPPTTRSSRRRSSARGSSRASRSTTSRRTSTRPRCSATSGSSGPRSRGETDDEFKDAHPARRCASSSTRPRPRAARARGRLGLLPGQRRRQRPRRLEGRRPAPQEWLRFRFPRQRKRPFLCIADFFRPVDVGRGRLRRVPHRDDGRARSASATAELFAADRYQEYLLLHGPRRRDGRGAGRAAGTAASARSGASPTRTARRSPACSASSTAAARYSWGYPACPDLEDKAKVAELLDARPHRRDAHRGVPARSPSRRTSAIISPTPRPSTSSSSRQFA